MDYVSLIRLHRHWERSLDHQQSPKIALGDVIISRYHFLSPDMVSSTVYPPPSFHDEGCPAKKMANICCCCICNVEQIQPVLNSTSCTPYTRYTIQSMHHVYHTHTPLHCFEQCIMLYSTPVHQIFNVEQIQPVLNSTPCCHYMNRTDPTCFNKYNMLSLHEQRRSRIELIQPALHKDSTLLYMYTSTPW